MAKRFRTTERALQALPPPVPLIGELAEFRIALNAEVDAAKRASATSAVPLSNGRLLGTLANGFQYQFDVDNALDLPGDTPGELRVPSLGSIPVTIVSIEGLAVTLSVQVDLGRFVPFATLQSNLSMLLLKLIERIEKKSTESNPAGDRLLGRRQPSGVSEAVTNGSLDLSGDRSLNPEQLAAVGSVLGRDTTYVWGPPGTGKTHIIGAIGGELFRRGQSLLLVSHTNTAVDGAMLQIARSIPRAEIEAGRLIRIGTPRDARFNEPENQALLLSVQRERRAATLTARKDALIAIREPLLAQERHLSRLVHLHEWLGEAESDTREYAERLEGIRRIRARLDPLREIIQVTERDMANNGGLRSRADVALWAKNNIEGCRQRLDEASVSVDIARQRLSAADTDVHIGTATLEVSERLHPIRAQLAKLPSLADATNGLNAILQAERDVESRVEKAERLLADAERVFAETNRVNWITRQWRGLPDPEVHARVVEASRHSALNFRTKLTDLRGRIINARSTLAEIQQLWTDIGPYSDAPTLSDQQQRCDKARRDQVRARDALMLEEAKQAALQTELTAALESLESFRHAEGVEPEDALGHIAEQSATLAAARSDLRDFLGDERDESDRLQIDINPRLRLLRELGFAAPETAALDSMVSALQAGVADARRRADEVPLDEAKAELATIAGRLRDIASELALIEEALRRIEETVIREATIVGATLTAAYLRDPVQTRRFDTVILDEASMAPIPALWTAVSVCDRAFAVVGDFRQLPPVVISTEAMAKKWLGTDPFQLAGLAHDGPRPDYFIGLAEQRRMQPEISAIVNSLIYSSHLRDHISVYQTGHATINWLASDWTSTEPVLLVDTGPLNAWVTSVSRGGSSASRLNFMSATVCADIAVRMLAPDREPWNPLDKPRMLVISPYRPHSKLVSLLLKDDGIEKEVAAGTVHTFQGAEADVVIFDLVNDTPHWRVGYFIPEFDESTRRSINVAVTRARKRLVVVGDFRYCQDRGKKAFLGKDFIHYLVKHHAIVDARDVVPEGLAGRASLSRSRIFGGTVEPAHDRIVVRQDRFFGLLASDLAFATERVVIYSPFITGQRLSELETHLRAAVERGASCVVVTKPLEERKKEERPTYRTLEGALLAWGLKVIHKRGMHEKLVLINADVVWTGSLNPLSFRDTQEIMERRQSSQVFEEYSNTLKLIELLKEHEDGSPTCPVCRAEVVASEGDTEPFYWRCVRDGCLYRRRIDDDSLRDGVVRCRRCGETVRLLEKDKDGEARWVCDKDSRHKQRVKPMHLLLPAVRQLIAKAKLARLERRLLKGIDTSGTPAGHSAEPTLFGDDSGDEKNA